MLGDLDLWVRVSGDTALLDHAAGVDPADVSAVTALRKSHDADRVAVALELCAARRKAAQKFGERGRTILADVQGIEQASGGAAAAYKAARVRESLGEAASVLDLCCGIGGDSMALADAGLWVVSVDREPVRAWMARRNTGGEASGLCADAADLAVDGTAIHLDPARRDESAGRRSWRLDDYRPGPEVIARLLTRASAAAVKLSPGVDLDALPWGGEIGFISDGGRLVQAVLWAGDLARHARSAVLIDGEQTHLINGDPGGPPLGEPARYLYTFDPAIERAGLIGTLCERIDAPALHPRLGLLTSDRVIASPWVTGFECLERIPWRPRRVRQWLAANDAGVVEVKTRGKACDPDREQQRLRGGGGTTYTVFVLRFDVKVEALITRRL